MAKPSPRQIRWLHRFQEFDLSIHHIPGKTNIVADILRRMHEDRKSEELYGPVLPIPSIIGSFIAPAHTVLDDWMGVYRQDPEVFSYFFNPATRELKDEKRQQLKYRRLWADDKIVVPKNRIQEIRPTTTPSSQVTGGMPNPQYDPTPVVPPEDAKTRRRPHFVV